MVCHNLGERNPGSQARRERGFERIRPFKLAGNVRRHPSALLGRRRRTMNETRRRVLTQVLPERLRTERLLLVALDLLLCFESWQRLCADQRLSVRMARAVVQSACLTLVEARAERP